jgi:hypothetical protein
MGSIKARKPQPILSAPYFGPPWKGVAVHTLFVTVLWVYGRAA